MTTQKDNYHHGDLRRALIDAAIELVAEKDVSSLSLREVARRVGVSHAAPYRHFADKDILLGAVAEEGFKELTSALNTAIEQALPHPLRRLEASGVAYVQYAIAHPSHYRVMFGSYRGEHMKATQPNPSLVAAGEQTFMVLVNLIMEGQSAGMVRPGDAKELAWVAWSLVHGLAMLLIDGQLPLSNASEVTSLANFMTQTLTQGLLMTK
ncbi:TetR/AcrR family transcriptional regulator [Iningainema tapete]|uniref:TetR/AcrR family transcriptional regulator n=1 Tax=Iningainema tapete BLCC-T55 TaxID=2748662 RepID=A0A8J6XRM3_9CYAN|nr:TetR/AcrR family transcriptional regulator [Iningainema tapete]MBD2775312.1 TetR/AcrR family transcriptional regulator [Iningainema tapete BLCC-T55]